MGTKWLAFLIGMWFDEDQRANTIETHAKKRLGYVFIYKQTTQHLIMNTIGRTYVFS